MGMMRISESKTDHFNQMFDCEIFRAAFLEKASFFFSISEIRSPNLCLSGFFALTREKIVAAAVMYGVAQGVRVQGQQMPVSGNLTLLKL